MSPLSSRHQSFVDEYIVDGNGTRAAIAAGYAESGAHVTASRLLRDERVAAALRTRRAELAAKHEISRDRVVQELLEAIDIAKANGDPGGMIRGWAEIGKLMGYYAPDKTTKIHVNISAKRVIEKMKTMTDAELLRICQTEIEEEAGRGERLTQLTSAHYAPVF